MEKETKKLKKGMNHKTTPKNNTKNQKSTFSLTNNKFGFRVPKFFGENYRHSSIAQLGERQTEDLKVTCSIHV